MPKVVDLDPPKDAPWVPSFYTKSMAKSSAGPAVALFAETFLRAIDGKNRGKPIKLTNWQKWLLNNLLQTTDENLWALREALVLLPRKNGKTFLIAIIMLYQLCFAPDYAQMFSGAKTQKQAMNVYKMVVAWINYNPELKAMFKISKATKTITNKYTGAEYRALAADSGSDHGSNPYFVIIDELHTMNSVKHKDFIEALTTGSGAQQQSLVVYISTAGANPEGNYLGDLYKRGIQIVEKNEPLELFGFYCWEAKKTDDIRDPEVWRRVNPMLAEGYLMESFIKGQYEKAKKTNPAFFMRFFLNIWASVAGDPFIQPMMWEAIKRPDLDIPFGAKVTVGFDGSMFKGDSCVIVVQDINTGVMKIWEIWERPADAPPSYHITREDVEDSFKKLFRTYDVQLVNADKFYYENDLVGWAYEYDWPISLVPQGGSQMREYSSDFQKDIGEEVIFHIDQEPLNRHIANTYGDDNKGFAKEDKHSPNKIDACVAAMLANGARNDILQTDTAPVEIWRFE